jgi:demethylmenaquinone methyltransferase/2-methoxy-6-polyprenyl-1,4-benzoquinol methylase
MLDYYKRRAAYYERVYHKPERQHDLRTMEAWLAPVFAGRRVLEVACGTGWWTPYGAHDARRWLATDLNPETMEIARAKAMPACVEFRTVDAFSFADIGNETFDGAFAGCWWSHLTLQQLPGWLATLHATLEPGARVVMLDNSFVQTSSTPDDGSVHEVVKNFPTPEQAFAALGPRARDPQWTAYTHYWLLSYTLA